MESVCLRLFTESMEKGIMDRYMKPTVSIRGFFHLKVCVVQVTFLDDQNLLDNSLKADLDESLDHSEKVDYREHAIGVVVSEDADVEVDVIEEYGTLHEVLKCRHSVLLWYFRRTLNRSFPLLCTTGLGFLMGGHRLVYAFLKDV